AAAPAAKAAAPPRRKSLRPKPPSSHSPLTHIDLPPGRRGGHPPRTLRPVGGVFSAAPSPGLPRGPPPPARPTAVPAPRGRDLAVRFAPSLVEGRPRAASVARRASACRAPALLRLRPDRGRSVGPSGTGATMP